MRQQAMEMHKRKAIESAQCTEVRFASFLSGGFTTTVVMYPPEKKVENCTSVDCIVISAGMK